LETSEERTFLGKKIRKNFFFSFLISLFVLNMHANKQKYSGKQTKKIQKKKKNVLQTKRCGTCEVEEIFFFSS
jgi:hypothetical protein